MQPESSDTHPVMDALTEIALNLRWSWNHAADELWSQLDAELWDLTMLMKEAKISCISDNNN